MTRDASVLTPREREILAAYARTGSQKAAAKYLRVQIGTVGAHFSHMYTRTHTCSPTELLLAVGWLRIPPPTVDSPCVTLGLWEHTVIAGGKAS